MDVDKDFFFLHLEKGFPCQGLDWFSFTQTCSPLPTISTIEHYCCLFKHCTNRESRVWWGTEGKGGHGETALTTNQAPALISWSRFSSLKLLTLPITDSPYWVTPRNAQPVAYTMGYPYFS